MSGHTSNTNKAFVLVRRCIRRRKTVSGVKLYIKNCTRQMEVNSQRISLSPFADISSYNFGSYHKTGYKANVVKVRYLCRESKKGFVI